MLKTAGNPTALMRSMAQQNPQMQQAMDLIQKSGGDPRKAFYTMAEQMGVDPEEVLSMLK